MSRRVVITGMGAVTPLGNNVNDFWQGLKRGKTGIGPITKFDTTNFKVKLAGEVRDFDPKAYMDFKTAKRMEEFCHFAIAAADEALRDAGLQIGEDGKVVMEDPYRYGVIVSSGIGSLQAHEREQVRYEKSGKIAPMYIPMMIANMASANIAIMYGMKGIKFHRRCFQGDQVRRCRCYGDRRLRGCSMPLRRSGIHRTYGSVHERRS